MSSSTSSPDLNAIRRHIAEVLVGNIRDESIRDCRFYVETRHDDNQMARRWSQALTGLADDSVLNIVPDIVDVTIFRVINALENDLLEFAVKDPASGQWIPVSEVFGFEASGDYIGDDGWREMFSSELVNPL